MEFESTKNQDRPHSGCLPGRPDFPNVQRTQKGVSFPINDFPKRGAFHECGESGKCLPVLAGLDMNDFHKLPEVTVRRGKMRSTARTGGN
jgi:hypothetical protein